jgi:Fe-S oxidoreductase
MFNKNTCKRCGHCLSKCPFLEMPLTEAEEEIARIIAYGTSEQIEKNCALCTYCDIVCPTQSNPSGLRKEILLKSTSEKGVECLSLFSEEVPDNLFTIGMEPETDEKKELLNELNNPTQNEDVFYLGCGISYIYSDLIQTGLVKGLPLMGGMKYCCGGYVHKNFGVAEAKIKGRKLLDEFQKLGLKKAITFCPGCEQMIKEEYPHIIEEFNIESQTFVDYLLEKVRKGEIEFTNKINRKIAFHDPCHPRKPEKAIYEGPRMLLDAMGAEVVEMKHNRHNSLCCGSPLRFRNPMLANDIVEKRIVEAKESGADTIAVRCTGCYSALSRKAAEHNLEIFYISELAQMAIGEKPPHRIEEILNGLAENMMEKIGENEELLTKKYVIKNGEIKPL